MKNWETDNFGSENVHVNIEDRQTLVCFAREWVVDNMNEDNKANKLDFLQEPKGKYPGFEFRNARDANKALSAWMFMIAEIEYFAKMYGQVLFLDWIKSGVSDIDWPY